MGRQAQGRPIQCLVVIGKMPYLNMQKHNIKTLFFKISYLIKIMLVLYPGRFIACSKKLNFIVMRMDKILISIAPSYKFITKEFTICYK